MSIGLVTDSTADLPQKILESYDIEVVPLNVHFGEELFKDGVDIQTDDFYQKLEESELLPSTSQPSVGDFLEKYREMGDKYDEIISIHISGELSGTVNSAELAARELSELDIKIIDSYGASLGHGFQVILAARMIAQGYSREEIIQAVEKARKNTSIYFTVGELTYLQEGGRIGKASALLGSVLNFNPILEIDTATGIIGPHSKTRGRKRTVKKMLTVNKKELTAEPTWLGYLNGKAGDFYTSFCEQMTAEAEKTTTELEIFCSDLGPVIGSHVGPLVYGCILLKGDFLV